jgi:HEAT repeat protein
LVNNNKDNTDGRQMQSSEEKIAHISNLGYSGDISNGDEVASFLEDDDLEVVGQACFYLGYLRARDHIAKLESLMFSSDDDLVNMVVSGLALMVDQRDVYLLDKLYGLVDSNTLLVKLSAIDAIGNIGSKQSAAILVERFDTEGENAVKAKIAEALGKLNNQIALPVLNKYLNEVNLMDHSVPNRGGVRGSELHPMTLKAILENSIRLLNG